MANVFTVFEIAPVLVRFDHVVSFVMEANGDLICVQTTERIMVAADFRAGLRCAL